MSLLLPDSGLLFWMTLIFLIVFFILAKFGFPVVTRMVDKRKEYIDNSLRLAREADEKMSMLAEEQARIMTQAREEQNRILKEAAQARDNMIRKAQEQAHDEAQKILDEAKVKIEAEKQSALMEIRSQVALLSVKVAEKVIRQDLSSDKAQIDLVYKLLDEVTAPGTKDKTS